MCKNLPSLVCCVLILGLAGGALGADPNLMGLWRCDEGTGTTAADSSGHGNDGTFNGNPQWVVGNFGGALEFDGADDSLDCGNDPSLDLTKWTIMFWLNLNENKNYVSVQSIAEINYRKSDFVKMGNCAFVDIMLHLRHV